MLWQFLVVAMLCTEEAHRNINTQTRTVGQQPGKQEALTSVSLSLVGTVRKQQHSIAIKVENTWKKRVWKRERYAPS